MNGSENFDFDGYLRFSLDQAHRFWSYFQSVAIACVGYAWADFAKDDDSIRLALCALFGVFACINHKLLTDCQGAALECSEELKKVERTGAAKKVLEKVKPGDLNLVSSLHIISSVVATFLILASTQWFARIWEYAKA